MGNGHARIAFVGEAPSYDEEVKGEPFVGPAGRIFNECLEAAGINRADVWVTNVFKYMIVPQSKTGKKIPAWKRAEMAGIDVQESIRKLRVELDDIKPTVIVPLGGTALWAMTGGDKIARWRGSILPAWNYKIVPTYHPAGMLYTEQAGNYWQKPIIQFDMRRALAQSKFPEIRRPSRNLVICKTSAQIADFYRRAKDAAKRNGGKIRLAVDIEALHCIPVCISLAFNKVEGFCIPFWNQTPLCKISDIPSSDLASIWIILDQILRDPCFMITGQNFKYDQDKIYRLGFNIPSLYSDTMLKAFTINPELSVGLAFNTSIYTEEPYYKDEGLDFDYTKHDISDLLLYGAKDAPVTWEIDEAMEQDLVDLNQKEFYYDYIMKLHDLYLHIENTGFRVSEENRKELLRKYIAWRERLKYELFKLTGSEVNVDSPKQVDILLYEVLKIPRRAGTGEEVLTQLLGNVVKKDTHKAVINNILEQRRVNKTVGNYLSALPDYDGRMKTSHFICLETGRTSTGMLEPPVRPAYDKKTLKLSTKKTDRKYIGAAFQVITKHGDVGGDVRRMYVADKGEVLLNCDSSQAEARVIALLSDDETTLKMYDTNDVHALTASWFLGGTEEKWSKKVLGYECPERFLGKTLRHAGHLGAKKKRASTEVNTQARKYHIDISISEAFAEKALRIFHQKSPKIQQVFHFSVIKCLEQNRRLVAPLPFGVDALYGGTRTFYEKWGDELFRQAFSYLPQRSISDNTKSAALRVRKRIKNIKIIVESHDSLTFSLPYNLAAELGGIIREEMQRPIRFETCSIPRRDLIIPADLEIGEDYKNLEKFKI